MKLKQISVMMENAPGRLYQVTQALAAAGVNLRAMTLADTADFGVLRLLVSEVATARRVLMEMHLPARLDEVVAFAVADRPGSLAEVLKPLCENDVNVQYMYAFAERPGEEALLVFRFSDNARALEILQQAGVQLTAASALGATMEGES